jgi:hypothetical protein
MSMPTKLPAALAGCFLLLLPAPQIQAEDLPLKYQLVANRGLDYLAKQQHRDGHWESNGGQFFSAMTGMAGTCLLMEGSTIREGKFAGNIRKAVDWIMSRCQRNGLIGEPNAGNQGLGYMYGHGFCMLFLSQVYGEEEDLDRRKKLEQILTRAAQFSARAQTSRGGWGYLSAADGNDFDEGSVSVTQVQALRAVRNSGIPVPKGVIDKTHEYLRKCTTKNGGLIYSLQSGGGAERPSITVAAIASMFNTGEYDSPLAKQWLKFCQPIIPVDSVGRDQFGHSEYSHYYYAQVIYMLGEDGYARIFPDSKPENRLTWSKYRNVFFEYLATHQNADGSWTNTAIGPVYTTSCYLTILQLDNGTLPIYQR